MHSFLHLELVGTNAGTSHENGPLDAPFPTLHDGQISLDGYLEPPPKAARISNGEAALEPKTLTPQVQSLSANLSVTLLPLAAWQGQLSNRCYAKAVSLHFLLPLTVKP